MNLSELDVPWREKKYVQILKISHLYKFELTNYDR